MRTSTLISAIAVTLSLTGCGEWRKSLDLEGTRPADASKLYPIGATLQRARLDVPPVAGPGPEGKSDAYFAVTKFLRQYERDGRGPLTLSAPHRSTHSYERNIDVVRSVAQANGLSWSRVRVAPRHDGMAHVTLSYDRIAAVAPAECGDWCEDVTVRAELGPHKSWGCASQRNLANMVADPTDLVTSAREADRGSERRAATHREYMTNGGKPVNTK